MKQLEMKRLKQFGKWLFDYRTWIPLVFWVVMLGLDWLAGGDYTNLFTRSGNIGILIVWSFMAWLLVGSLTDHAFLPDKTWEESWKEGHQLAVSIIIAGRFIFAGLIGSSLINPF